MRIVLSLYNLISDDIKPLSTQKQSIEQQQHTSVFKII